MLVGTASAFLVLAGVYFTAWLIGPVVPALIIVIVVSPVQSWLLRRGWPGWLTTLVLVILVAGLLLLFAVVIVVSIARLAALLPQYADRADIYCSLWRAVWRSSASTPHSCRRPSGRSIPRSWWQ
jgi:predicted PurR-regulated permease PerM